MLMKNNAGCGAFYGMGMLGALVYFMVHAGSFSEVILGIFKAIFWPGVVMFRALELLQL